MDAVGPGEEPLTITSARVQNGRPVIGFEGFSSIEDVERLAGLELRVPEDTLQPLGEGAYYQHQLVGCAVETVAGERGRRGESGRRRGRGQPAGGATGRAARC